MLVRNGRRHQSEGEGTVVVRYAREACDRLRDAEVQTYGIGKRFVTGGTFDETTRRYLEESGVPCLTKPVSREELRDLVFSKLPPGDRLTRPSPVP